MTTADHLRLIDGMRTEEFPPERVASACGVSGPGYHTALLPDADRRDEGDEADRLARRAHRVAAHEALLTLLTLRWGEPQPVSLWSAQERMAAGEAIAEPWAGPVASCEHLLLWRTEDRWTALVRYPDDDGPDGELGVVVTVVDPP
ncbi:hypothetical protein ABZ172_04335 [Streptomyces sp. NPDC006296]|uniref:hypothetical protein n=1 Tax=Streptomyces sp. NPDC006296 TaxID=3156746 RepID=UPI00339DB89D